MHSNNIFMMTNLLENLILCNVCSEEQAPQADHILVVIVIYLPIKMNKKEKEGNFRNIKWDLFKKALIDELGKIPMATQF